MTVEAKPIRVICPLCNKETKVDVPVFIVNDARDGMVKIQIPQGVCCDEHSFMAFVDKKFIVRGYQNADIEFKIGTKEKTVAQKKTEGLKDYSITDMVSSIGPDICAVIFRGILVGCPILLLDTFDLYNRVEKTVTLLKDIASEELVINCEKITKEDTKDKKSRRQDDLIVVPLYQAIMRSPFGETINTRFEISLLREATQLPDRTSQIVFLRKELVKIKRIIEEFVKLVKSTDKLYEEDIPTYTKNKFNYKLDAKNVDVIKQIIEFKDKKLAQKIISKSLDKIRTDLW
ncbi:MAG TPA: hypothetical protein VKM55_08610 [Candidatus Lokiarchaeia archaeon]|nr:hypothetical protein [Candidatus Lokiarchaeia archaeon]